MAGFLANAAIVETLKHVVSPLTAQLFAFPAAVTATWWLNRRYTFASRQAPSLHEWNRYLLANGPGWVVNNSVFLALTFQVPLTWRHPAVAVAAGSVASMFVNFSLSRTFVFRAR
jgi:putative flippase GtrA